MNAYIKLNSAHWKKDNETVYWADVVSEFDYKYGGHFAHSYRAFAPTSKEAKQKCIDWMKRHNYKHVSVAQIAGK